jgi:chorismate dehydratase
VLHAGRIIYTNDIPIYAAFDEGAVSFPGSLHADVPARLNAKLLSGELALSPISAFFYAKHANELALMPNICIGSRRNVWSVILASPMPPEALDNVPIAVTTESASGRNLLRVLLERRYGVRANFVETADPLGSAQAGRPTLLIGDLAIDAQLALPPHRIYDLGALWHEWTAHDMVFAVWAVRRDVLAARRDTVLEAIDCLECSRSWGAANAHRVVANAQAVHARPAGFYASYYDTLNFAFDEQAQAGLARFISELAAIGAVDGTAQAHPEQLLVTR